MYNCRTSNAWPRDLALTATHFPHCGLTFAVMFGCSVAVETNMVRRLSLAVREAAHPALLPGILIELERSRHIGLVENITKELEDRIGEVKSKPENVEALSEAENDRRVVARKEAWMNTKYLESHLVSWNSLLLAFTRHLDEIQFPRGRAAQLMASAAGQAAEAGGAEEGEEAGEQEAEWPSPYRLPPLFCYPCPPSPGLSQNEKIPASHPRNSGQDAPWGCVEPSPEELMCHTSRKIKSRVREIIHEYHEKIRECALRVDGMAMATQWVS